MIKRVSTSRDLLRALAQSTHEIQICSERLAFELITRPEKLRLVLRKYGYRLCKTMYLGRFEVRLLRYAAAA